MIKRNTETENPLKRFVLTGKALSVSTPCIMGVLNATPDSFSDGGQFDSVNRAVDRIGRMILDGASIIDIGGESTRPGSDQVSEQEEVNRVMPVIEKVLAVYPDAMFSIDTTKYEVARLALNEGVHMVNDISGLQREPRLADLCAQHHAYLVIMHSRESPKTMQNNPEYRNVNQEIADFLLDQADIAKKAGVSKIVVDPGIGFGKTAKHNLEIIAQLDTFTQTGYPVLIGASRKSVIGHILADEKGPRPVEMRLAGTLALHYHALMKGAAILRVHDVREARDTIEIFMAVTTVTS